MDVESLAKELILKNMTPEQQMAVLDSVRQSVVQAKEVQKRKIGENVDLVVQALKKIESDIRSRFDDVGNSIEKRVASIQDGRDGADGKDGRDGKDGKNGRDGAKGDRGERGQDGRDGVDGVDGVSVTNARIDFDGSLIITLSTGIEINVGEVVAPDLAERIKVITNGGGTSQSVLDTLASLQTEIDNLIPSQTGNSGKYLTTNGTALSWASVAGGLSYQGTWNANTNTPTLTSSVGVNGYYYIVDTAGSTNLNGITDWQIGDWLLFNGSVWQKIDQSNLVTSVAGRTGAVTLSNTDISGLGTMSTQNASSVAITGGTATLTSLTTPTVQATNSGGLSLKNSAGTTQLSMGGGGGDNLSLLVSTNINGTNAQVDISPTGTGHVHIKPTGVNSIEIAPTYVGEIENMTIGAVTPKNGSFVDLSVTGTTSFDGSQGTAGQVLTSAGTGATPTWTTPTVGTVTSVSGTSPVASSGGATPAISLAANYGDTQNPYASKTANFVLAAPDGSSGAPTFRAVVAADIPTLNQNTTGSAATVTTTINSGVVATTQTAGDNSTKVATTAYVNAITGTGGLNGFKNRIINGAMVIDQRNAGASVTPTASAYTLDRWLAVLTQASKFSVQQNAGSITPPVGFTNYLGITSTSAYSVLTGDTFIISQPIEGFNTSDFGFGTASASTVTLSFRVYSSLTGTFGGALINSAANRSYLFSYSIPTANTWTTISVTIAGDTSGTWLTTNGIGIVVRFGLGSGSTFSGTAGAWGAGNLVQPTGTVSVVGTSGATFYITGVQLEKGSTATSFDYRPYGTELALCQRYYEKTYNDGVALGTVTSVGQLIVYVDQLPNLSSRTSTVIWLFKVSKRATPTITTYSPAVGTINTVDSSTNAVAGSVSSIGMNSTRIAVTDTVTTTASYISAHATASSEL
jgi:hypothetical protein